MPKKLTYDYVKSSFNEEGYVLLSKVYVNNATPLRCQCPKGHVFKVRWNDWSNKDSRCPFCSGRRVTLDRIITDFDNEGYAFLKGIYVGNRSKLNIRCPEGHTFDTTRSRWTSGNRCPYCSNRVRLKARKGEITDSLAGEEYIFKGFDGRHILYECHNGHKHRVLWTDWKKGIRCPYCYGNNRKDINEIREFFMIEGYVLKSDMYNNCYTKLSYTCPKGHNGTITWNDWQQGCRCRICANINTSIMFSGPGHPNWQGGKSFEPYCQDWTKEYKEYIKERDGNICLNPYCFKDCDILAVHHVDYNKTNCEKENLITLCRSCNSRANKDRIWHKGWYKAILYRRYGYE